MFPGCTMFQMRKNKPLDESHKSGQTSRTKVTFYSNRYFIRKVFLLLPREDVSLEAHSCKVNVKKILGNTKSMYILT
ncbi:hypothetical protein HanPI659440_Chr16g0648741 [Helianthus annuus]|nr:hypothetical protein HanPI659440_Chr16g0648741 [Helianthus annuus]